MILPRSPSRLTKEQLFAPLTPGAPEAKAIGYWADDDEPYLPDPSNFVNPAWDPAERAKVVEYLSNAEVRASWRGISDCRLCGVHNGSECHGDSRYVWPSGFAHYLTEHNVRPPQEFVDHVLATIGSMAYQIDSKRRRGGIGSGRAGR